MRLIALVLALLVTIATAQQFDLKVEGFDGNAILIWIDAPELPDNAEVRVGVHRLYVATDGAGVTDTFRRDYYKPEELELLGDWREPRRIALDPEAWMDDLLAFQREMGAISKQMSFTVDSIADEVSIDAYVYGHKTGERFGPREYESLMVRVQNVELVAKSELEVDFPLP